MVKNTFKFLIIGLFWLVPTLTYFNSPITIDYALICFIILVFSLIFLIFKFSKKTKFNIGNKEYICLSLFIFVIILFIFGFVIEANNLESNKKFVDFIWLDFIFPISIISLASLPATYLILTKSKK